MRGGFSDRNAIKPINEEIQLTEFDERTRAQLQNMLSHMYDFVYNGNLYWGNSKIQDFLQFVMGSIYSECIDTRETIDDDKVIKILKETLANGDYDEVLTVIEALIQYWDDFLKTDRGNSYYNPYNYTYVTDSLFAIANQYFEREFVGYRFLDRIIVPISDPNEIETIKETLQNRYESIYDHISKANSLLSDRNSPDYENSIKESITAVEAACEILTGTKGKEATLGIMLKKLETSGIEIHSAMKTAFNALYGYTSDANGIRHAGDIGGAASTFEEAKFMLVSCCAFINYLIANSAK
jgi:hypothetical protein